jgi:hypothetical protein
MTNNDNQVVLWAKLRYLYVISIEQFYFENLNVGYYIPDVRMFLSSMLRDLRISRNH